MHRRLSGFTLAAIAVISVLAAAHFRLPARPVSAATSADPNAEVVFITDAGVIQVWDPPPASNPTVDWVSPTAGWADIALCDVNDDGDLEIIAYNSVQPTFTLAVFDPVIASGVVDPNKKTPNGIPWDTLHQSTWTGRAEFAVCNNFDNGIPGDEIAFGFQETSTVFKVIILNADGSSIQPNGKPSGRAWKIHISRDFDHEWIYATSGQLNGVGADELVLVDGDSDLTQFEVYDMDRAMERVDGKSTDSHRWRRAAVGQVITGGVEELVAIRSVEGGSNESLFVYRMNEDSELETEYSIITTPNPEFVFLADVTGNGDEEVLYLRNHDEEDGERLLMVDEWGNDQDRQIRIQSPLEGGDDYETGAGGDIDGDGRDEIIIIRDNKIRVFTTPESSIADNTLLDFNVNTNRDSLQVGDLDSQGFVSGPQFASDKSKIEARTPVGTQSDNYTVQLSNLTSSAAIPFTVRRDYPSYITVTPTNGNTPATLNVRFNATNLAAGKYTHTLLIDSPDPTVVNDPYAITLELTIDAAAVVVSPGSAAFVYLPCPNAQMVTQSSITLDVGGTRNLKFSAGVVDIPDEVSAALASPGALSEAYVEDSGSIHLGDANGNSLTLPATGVAASATSNVSWPEDVSWIMGVNSLTNTVPSTMTIHVDAAALGNNFSTEAAMLVVIADSRAGGPPDNVRLVPITMFCANSQLHLPLTEH
jgi:hypothetical protein